MKFLLLGRGSIGRRHESILHDLGHEVTTVDPAPGAEADYRQASVPHYQGLPEDTVRVTKHNFDGVLDCTPPDIRAAWNVSAKARFIEKPLGALPYLGGASTIDAPVMLGFCYRYLLSLEAFVAELTNVRIFSLSLVSGQWLPDWHDDGYRRHYHGTPGRGGIILDSLPHSLFIARWILGDLRYVGSVAAKLSGLDIHTEDTAAMLLEAPAGQPAMILADYLRKPRDFYCEAITSSGVRRWEFDPDEADVMYRRQMEAFVEAASGERRYGYPSLAEGVAVQQLLEQCLKEE